MASQYMVVDKLDIAHTARKMSVGTNHPASANMLGSDGTPGPVMLFINKQTEAKNPIVLPPPKELDDVADSAVSSFRRHMPGTAGGWGVGWMSTRTGVDREEGQLSFRRLGCWLEERKGRRRP